MESEHLKSNEPTERYLEPKLINEISLTTRDLIISTHRKGHLHIVEPETYDENSPKERHFGVFFNRQDESDKSFNPSTSVRAVAENNSEGTAINHINVQTDFGQDPNYSYLFDISETRADIGVYHWEGLQNNYFGIEDAEQRQELLERLQVELDGVVSLADNETGNFS